MYATGSGAAEDEDDSGDSPLEKSWRKEKEKKKSHRLCLPQSTSSSSARTSS